MELEQRLLWASRADGIACFFEGRFVRFYQAQLAWFCKEVKAIKVSTRQINKLDGLQIYYGGISKRKFNAWLAQSGVGTSSFSQQPMPWGVWLVLADPIDTKNLLAWCAQQVTLSVDGCENVTNETIKANNVTTQAIIQQLRSLSLTDITPVQALHFLSLWQYLLNESEDKSITQSVKTT